MGDAKKLIVKPISSKDANRIIKSIHYSRKVVNNSQLHFGVFMDGKCGGAMSFGCSLDKRKTKQLVRGTGWNSFIELNRMAFADWLPQNGESRCIAYALRYIKKHYPHIEWVISFADGCQCGDGTIYRASGFSLTSVKKNTSMWENIKTGERRQDMQFFHTGTLAEKKNGDWKKLTGYMLRYIYFLNKSAKERLTVPILPYSDIDKAGAGMYKGKSRIIKCASSETIDTPGSQSGKGGVIPTDALHLQEAPNGEE